MGLSPDRVLFSYCCMLSGEATNINFIVFALTRSGLKPMIYCTGGEHANHYTTDSVMLYKNQIFNNKKKQLSNASLLSKFNVSEIHNKINIANFCKWILIF
jgi:hypothetical protein